MDYIHYGHDSFDPVYLLSTMNPVYKYRRRDKPHGLWASPVDCKWGWKDWCESEDYSTGPLDKSFTFELKTCRVLHVRKPKDIEPYVERVSEGYLFDHCKLNLAKIYNEYDAMELHLSENWRLRDIEVFYGWDVDSIVVWNPDVVVLK